MEDGIYQYGSPLPFSKGIQAHQIPAFSPPSDDSQSSYSDISTPVDPFLPVLHAAAAAQMSAAWIEQQQAYESHLLAKELPTSSSLCPGQISDSHAQFAQSQHLMSPILSTLHEQHGFTLSQTASPSGNDTPGSALGDTSTGTPHMAEPESHWSGPEEIQATVGSPQPYLSEETPIANLQLEPGMDGYLGLSDLSSHVGGNHPYPVSQQPWALTQRGEGGNSGSYGTPLGEACPDTADANADANADVEAHEPWSGTMNLTCSQYGEDDGEKCKSEPPRKRSRSVVSEARSPSGGCVPSRNERGSVRVDDDPSAGERPPIRRQIQGPSRSNHGYTPAGPPFSCDSCNTSAFSDEAGLRKHIRIKHTRPFTCVFHFAGCPSSFPNKNEWKRHVLTQHVVEIYWKCTLDPCVHFQGTDAAPGSRTSQSAMPASSGPPPRRTIFKRKDLLRQHLRRMHMPPADAAAASRKEPTPEWDERLRQLQADAETRRCALPTYMRCPVPDCKFKVRGPNAWDKRMEHVATHLERAAEGNGPRVQFGGDSDPTLTEWAEGDEVGVIRRNSGGEWELVNPLRGNVDFVHASETGLGLVDAEGEDD